jgi:1-acyl-sn-glycerol-3-phosphate acyltransferase
MSASAGARPRPGFAGYARIAVRLPLVIVLVGLAAFMRGMSPALRVVGIAPWKVAAIWFRVFLPVIGVRVVERGAPPAEAALIAANHISWLDIAVLGRRVGGGFLSKAEVARWPLVGWFATGTGTVYLPRGANQTREANDALIARMRNRQSIVIFPEGTTTGHRLPKLFHGRLFAAAIEGGKLVQPVALHYPPPPDARTEQHPLAPYVNNDNMLRHLLRLLVGRGLTVEVTYCPPIRGEGLDRRQIAERAWEAVCLALGGAEHVQQLRARPRRERHARRVARR